MNEVKVVCEKKGVIIGRVKKARVGWTVYDSNKRKIGKIVDLFGPVSNPYVRIKILRKRDGKILIGGEDKWRKKRKRRSG